MALLEPSVGHRGSASAALRGECLGSGADAKALAGVPHVCTDCVRGENE
jgi:hypothetical protein